GRRRGPAGRPDRLRPGRPSPARRAGPRRLQLPRPGDVRPGGGARFPPDAAGAPVAGAGAPIHAARAGGPPGPGAGAARLPRGLLVVRRLGDDQPAGPRVAGTGVALAGLALMAAGVGLAWPAPGPLLASLVLAGTVLSVTAFTARVPWAHLGAVPALALAGLL